MGIFNCSCTCKCAAAAVIASIILGVVAAFLQITGMITVTPAFLWVALGIAIVYLGVLVIATALSRRREHCDCLCTILNTVLAGILGTSLVSVILLAVGVVATSVISAILVGLLVLFLSLTVAATACVVKNLADCDC